MKTFTSFSPAAGTSHGSLLLVHGAGEHFGRYHWAVQQWNEAGYDVLGGDLPGYGQNEGKKGHINSFEEYIEAVSSWYDLLRRTSHHVPFIFGHSLGGLVVARFMETKQKSVKGVVLTSPCFAIKVKIPAWKESIAKALNVIYPSLVLGSEIQPHEVTRNQEIVQLTAVDPLNTKGASVRWYHELIRNMKNNWLEQHSFPDVPLVIHQAGDDRITDKNEARKWFESIQIQDKTFKEWQGLYHEILNEPERQLAMDEILEWMQARRV